MTPKDMKKCADFMRESLDKIEKMFPDNAQVKKRIVKLRQDAEDLWPAGERSFARIQWEEIKRRIGWQGTEKQYEDAMRVSLEILKARHPRDRKPDKPEIAY